jgi:hypothetical protein
MSANERGLCLFCARSNQTAAANFQPPPIGIYLGLGIVRELAMDKTVARLNIEHYRKLLAIEVDETRRQMLARLLAEEEAKLAGLENPTRKRKTDR